MKNKYLIRSCISEKNFKKIIKCFFVDLIATQIAAIINYEITDPALSTISLGKVCAL